MKVVIKGVCLIVAAIVTQMGCANAHKKPIEIFRTDGEVSQAESGWTYQAGSDEEMVYIPFEGMYPNKGGRMQSPWFTLPEGDGHGAYYRLTFKARTAEHCYWWLDYLDKDGQRVPDCNSEVYIGDDFRDYDEVVYVPGKVRQVQIAFVSKGKVEATDIRFTTATAEEAAQWCDDVFNAMPPLNFTAPANAMALLPKTVAAMKNGKPWRVVMLGDSLMNDTFNSVFQALIQRDFPESRFDVLASVRGVTGCEYYREPEQFQKYIVAQRPDLLVIRNSHGGEDLEEVIKMALEQVGCEIAVMTTPLARDWREQPETLDWRSIKNSEGDLYYDLPPVRESTRKLNVTLWDITAPCNDYLVSAGDIDLKRDWIHNNDNGKQLIGRVLREFFLTAEIQSQSVN